ncbi:Anaerobic sulfatase-maturating enzyme [compost metagenome]
MCLQCDYRFACHGECPKNRFMTAPNGEPGLNYLCPGYKKYFRHLTPYMNAMAQLISHNQPASLIMQAFSGPLLVPLDR